MLFEREDINQSFPLFHIGILFCVEKSFLIPRGLNNSLFIHLPEKMQTFAKSKHNRPFFILSGILRDSQKICKHK